MIEFKHNLLGSILDIGGGGEGIIGRVYGSQVIAIDNRQEELNEAPDGFKKILMDARCLDFPDEKYDHVTFFYSLMFMEKNTQIQAIREAIRVLKIGGSLHIWDAQIRTAYPDPFIVDLDICIDSEKIHTTYGVVSSIKNQTEDSICKLCMDNNMKLRYQQVIDGQFYLIFIK